jgi:hypothetical protein
VYDLRGRGVGDRVGDGETATGVADGDGAGEGDVEGDGEGVSACPTMPMSAHGADLSTGLLENDVEIVAATSINSRTATRSLGRRRPTVGGVREPGADFS